MGLIQPRELLKAESFLQLMAEEEGRSGKEIESVKRIQLATIAFEEGGSRR